MFKLYNFRSEVRTEIIEIVSKLLTDKCRGSGGCPFNAYADCLIDNLDCGATEVADWIKYFNSEGD